MPIWSDEIANEFIRLAASDGKQLDQMRLQKLVFIAHGLNLALTGQPLTGDRPEAWSFGPVYRRITERFVEHGTSLIPATPVKPVTDASNLEFFERDLVDQVYNDYGACSAAELATLTYGAGTAWSKVFVDGSGRPGDISHSLVREQFVEFTAPEVEQ